MEKLAVENTPHMMPKICMAPYIYGAAVGSLWHQFAMLGGTWEGVGNGECTILCI
jgi:hypothetical protein